ncbi:MAG: cupin domain-containing protein [Thermomicrobiales bacterium]|nr:MAG: cupin domain-containing protein [Thermomicrobiales bacterium]
MPDPSAIDWSAVPVEHPLAGIARQTVHGENQTLVRYVYQPGSVFPVHKHPEEQITVICSGSIDFTVDGSLLTLSAGDVAIIPGNVPHGATVTGNEIVETLNTMSPRRTSAPMSHTQNEESA